MLERRFSLSAIKTLLIALVLICLALCMGVSRTAYADGDNAQQANVEEGVTLLSTQAIPYTVGSKNTVVKLSSDISAVSYNFTLSESGALSLTGTASIEYDYLIYSVCGPDGKVLNQGNLYNVDSDFACTSYLNKGDYSIKFEAHEYSSSKYAKGTVKFSTSFSSSGESFDEAQNGSNNSIEEASPISVNKGYYSFFSGTDAKDVYKVEIDYDGTYAFSSQLKDGNASVRMSLYDADGFMIDRRWAGSPLEKEYTVGTYYLVFEQTYISDSVPARTGGSVYFEVSAEPTASGLGHGVISKNTTVSNNVSYEGDLYVEQGCALVLLGDTAIDGNVYVFGTLINRGNLTVTGTLNALHYGKSMSAGNYPYSYFYNYSKANINKLNITNSFLNVTIPTVMHEYDSGTISTEPTCTNDGVKTYECMICGEKKTEAVEKLGHSYDEGVVTKRPTSSSDGVKTYTCTRCGATKTEAIPKIDTMYRLYNPNSGEHFYTASASERDGLRYAGWRYEGVGWTAPKISSTPVYRLYSGTDHHYTTSAEERDNLINVGWKDEGVGWYSDDAKGQALYRQYNPNVNPKAKRNNSGSHNYTTSKAENDQLVKAGWHEEGIGWYGVE